MKKVRGITLISLVITIIILIILAGISIVGLFGNNGLITNAIKIAKEQKKQGYFEELKLEIIDEQTERAVEPKEEKFIKSLKDRIKNRKWTNSDNVIMCKETEDGYEEQEKIEDNTLLIVDTLDNYEILIDVSNIELTAQIREDYFEKVEKYKVKYEANGGNGERPEEQEIKKGFSIILPENKYTRSEYEFAGWNTDKNALAGELEGSKYVPNGNETLYAIWTKTSVTITFDSNGGEGQMNSQTMTANEETTLPENIYTKTGNSFVKWNTKQDGTGTDYANGAKITLGENTTLYAQWEQSAEATINVSNNKKLTKGSKITIGGTSYSSNINKVEVTIGEKLIYIENVSETKTYTKELGIGELGNVDALNFNDDYNIKLKITTTSGIKKEVTIENVRSYLIANTANLNALSWAVNNGTTFSGETVYQIANIVASNDFIPIGYYNGGSAWDGPYFAGTYEGGNNTITVNSMSKDSKYKSSGVFGMVIGGNINYLKVYGTNDAICSNVGGIAGGIKDSNILYCENYATNTNLNNSIKGGIVGITDNSIITNCTNNAQINGYTFLGGICGRTDYSSQIKNSINNEKVIGSGVSEIKWGDSNENSIIFFGITGGITGVLDNSSLIEGCTNNSNINLYMKDKTHTTTYGGIAGTVRKYSTISKSTNRGTINYAYESRNIKYCRNSRRNSWNSFRSFNCRTML